MSIQPRPDGVRFAFFLSDNYLSVMNDFEKEILHVFITLKKEECAQASVRLQLLKGSLVEDKDKEGDALENQGQ